MHWTYRVCYPIVWTLLFLFSRWRVYGKENVPREGPVLVVANHMANLDTPLLGVSLGRYAAFMAKKGLFRSRLTGYFLSGLGGFPVSGNRVKRETLRFAGKALADGHALVIFPEGMRSRTSQLRRAFPGAAQIALQKGVPVLPAAITGTEVVGGMGWLRLPRLTVTFGRPFYLPPTGDKTDLEGCTNYMMERIAGLLPPSYRGVYANAGMEQ